MKTNLIPAIVAALAAFTFATAGYAQFKPAHDDGIAASPKLRQLLDQRKAKAPAPLGTPAMACDKCADVRTAKLSPQAKGAEVMTGAKQVSFSHSCTACETKLALAGEGKAKHEVVTRECSRDAVKAGGCCVSR